MTLLVALAAGCGGTASATTDGSSRTSFLTFDIEGVHRTATSVLADGPSGSDPAVQDVRIQATGTAFALNIYLFVSLPFDPGSYSCASTNGSTLTYYEAALHVSTPLGCTVTFTEIGAAVDGWLTGTFSSQLDNPATSQITNGAFDVKRRN